MQFEPAQLAALAQIIRLGSFEAAADALGVTPSAISQRLKALEERVGATLVERTQPCQPTPIGARLAKHAEDLALLEVQVQRDIGAKAPAQARVTLATPADVLGSWFPAALAAVPGLLCDIRVDDQDTSDDWLRRGAVNAVVTGHDRAAPGCDIHPLGAMRYVATASPAFIEAHFAKGVTAQTLTNAPMLTFNEKDRLQHRWAAMKAGKQVTPPTYQMPSTHAFIHACRHGLAWGLQPELLVRDQLSDGTLIALDPSLPLDVPLYWQVTRVMAGALRPLTQAVRKTAGDFLQ